MELEEIRVLYVDDDMDARRIFVRELRKTSLRIDVASNGVEAISLARENTYAVIASDLDMPGMNGIELFERIHGIAPMASFVLVTGAVSLNLPTASESARAITCIVPKPWEQGELENAVMQGIRLHQTRTVAKNPAVGNGKLENTRILLLEDCLGDARLIERMLTKVKENSYSVIHVARLSEACAVLETVVVDLIVTDMSLPDARGLDVVKRLKVTVPEVPVIVMSGQSDKQLAAQAVQSGAQDYLVKGEVDGISLDRAICYSMKRKATEQRLAYMAHYDELTGLANRTAFRQRAIQSLAKSARKSGVRPAILLLDLDRFKIVNDTLGHDVGDLLLREVASRIQLALRDTDMVARLGGDEFAVLVDDIGVEEHAAAPAQRIIEFLAPVMRLEEHELYITTSIGIAIYPKNGQTIEDLLKNADSAMYRAKEGGRNSYQFFDEAMHVRAMRRMELERDLQGALRREEFVLFFQPLIALETNKPVCFEALLRWQHPVHGLIQPDDFIPLLEDSGLIVPVGEWVLEQACVQIKEWQSEFDEKIRVAVNVSPRQFDDAGLVDAVKGTLQATGLEPFCLELEVTENLVMRDIESAVDKLQLLKNLGVRIAVDDFGTGQSQLIYLVRFPVDTLKIDKSVTQMIGSREGNMITKMVVDMGHNLDLELVAEGVEDEVQLEFLREQKCHVYQGYYSTKPIAPSACEAWWRSWLVTNLPMEPDKVAILAIVQ